jgi:hypothetical protein
MANSASRSANNTESGDSVSTGDTDGAADAVMALRFDEILQYTKYRATTNRDLVSPLQNENYPAAN